MRRYSLCSSSCCYSVAAVLRVPRHTVALTSGCFSGGRAGLLSGSGIQRIWDLPESMDDSLCEQWWIPN